MNDFTKEELLVISHDIGILNDEAKISYEHADINLIICLRKKIQRLIDNYQEPLPTCAEDKHDWEFVDHGSAGYYKCLVCQRSYNEQTRLAE